MDEITTLGDADVLVEPLWRVQVRLTDVERELLATWPVRRLGFIAHAGASSIATVQSYTRLEHSLGLLALVAHVAPSDRTARVAALLHDVGHLPFSHTLEGIAGLDHHDLGARRIRSLSPLLARHGLDAETVIDVVDGRLPSPLHGPGPGMRLDHLESFVRSERSHGRTTEPPPATLARLRLRDGAVDTDADTAAALTELVLAEARSQTSRVNLVTTAVMRDLVDRLLRDETAATPPAELAEMTDHDLWGRLLACPSTRAGASRLRARPDRWTLTIPESPDATPPPGTIPSRSAGSISTVR